MISVFEYPEIPMSIVSGLVFAALVGVGIVAVRRFVHPQVHGEGSMNGIVEITLTVFSLFYGILLGLLVVNASQNVNSISDLVTKEADTITNLYLNTQSFPQPARDEIHNVLWAYIHEVVENSFPAQARGLRPTGETPLIAELFKQVNSFVPTAKNEEAVQVETMRELRDLQETRHMRLSNYDIGIPASLWWIVGLGAAINLLLICLLDFPLKTHIAFGGLLAFFIGATIFVIASMDNPFTGSDHVTPQPMQRLLELEPTLR